MPRAMERSSWFDGPRILPHGAGLYRHFKSSRCRPRLTVGRPFLSAMLALTEILVLTAMLDGCAGERSESVPAPAPITGSAAIERALPYRIADRAGWIDDIHAAFMALKIPESRENVCAVTSVAEQESGFQVDPVIPNLGLVAWREIDRRAAHAGLSAAMVHRVLELKSPDGRSYSDRIQHARTEKELSDIFEAFTGSIPLGETLFASWNPIRTRGPMQVNVAFAEHFSESTPYPFPVKKSLADELFTRRGSVYFGTAHLLDYAAPYDRYLFRFADFNAGQYSSRNAAFQVAVSAASGMPLSADGALLPRSGETGSTEHAVQSLSERLGLNDEQIHAALEQGRSKDFERTAVYASVFELAERRAGRPLARAVIPTIKLGGPKITRNLTTDWYAHRVEQRFERCLAR
jgi:Protein of unknown function (DUF1615)